MIFFKKLSVPLAEVYNTIFHPYKSTDYRIELTLF